MLVREVMSPKPLFIEPDTSVQKAAQLMQENDCGFLPIGENDRLIGMVTDRDICTRCAANGLQPDEAQVRNIMSENVWYVYEEDDIERALQSMSDLQVRRLIVLDNDKRMTGIVSLGDLACRCGNDTLCGEALEHISEKH